MSDEDLEMALSINIEPKNDKKIENDVIATSTSTTHRRDTEVRTIDQYIDEYMAMSTYLDSGQALVNLNVTNAHISAYQPNPSTHGGQEYIVD